MCRASGTFMVIYVTAKRHKMSPRAEHANKKCGFLFRPQ
jgi:hypothetical protein